MASPKRDLVLAFDVYGTLLSTDSIAKKLSVHFGDEKAQTIATAWRKHQLEYTWRMNSMGIYLGFDTVTRRSLQQALAESRLELDDDQSNDLMTAYDSLSTFSDVQPTLERLGHIKDVKVLAFSNGTYDMVARSIQNSPNLSPHASTFHDIISVEECRKFKPAAEVYWHLAAKMGKDSNDAKGMAEIWLVSSNPFDVTGARAVGMKAIWVDRAGSGWQDRLSISLQPSEVVRSLEEVADVVVKEL